MPYAAQTKVPISKTKTDIEDLLSQARRCRIRLHH